MWTSFFFSLYCDCHCREKKKRARPTGGCDSAFIHLCLASWINLKLPSIPAFDYERENLRAGPWGKHTALGHLVLLAPRKTSRDPCFSEPECIRWQTTNGAVLQGCALHANPQYGLTFRVHSRAFIPSHIKMFAFIYLAEGFIKKWHVWDGA